MKLTKLTVSKFLLLLATIFALQTALAVQVSDSSIVSSIQQQLSNDPETSSQHVNLASQRGVVTIAGIVDTNQQASAIVAITQSTPGVMDINTQNLKVKQSQDPLEDTFITAKIKGLFLRDKLFGDNKDITAMGVKVETKNGIVHLSGEAQFQAEIQNAIQVARSVKGVRHVQSHIKLSKS